MTVTSTSNGVSMTDMRLSFEKRNIVSKRCFTFGNVVEVQRHWSYMFGIQSPRCLTMSQICENFGKYGTMCDAYKEKTLQTSCSYKSCFLGFCV